MEVPTYMFWTPPDTKLPPPSAIQHEITHGPHQTVLSEAGNVDGSPSASRLRPGEAKVPSHGPNRIGDRPCHGAGRQTNAALNDPLQQNASYYLSGLRWWAQEFKRLRDETRDEIQEPMGPTSTGTHEKANS